MTTNLPIFLTRKEIHVKVDQIHISNKNQLQISVKDTGIGISQEELPYIFERFYQAASKSDEKRADITQEGTGIGLALTKELVEMLGGDITVKSELSWGSLFRVTLPIHRNGPIAVKLNEQTSDFTKPYSSFEQVDSPMTSIDSTKPLLLVIEDNIGIVAYIKSIVGEDYEISVAVNGEEGIDKAIATIPDIIITDVMMPLKNGYEVCETLKKDERTSHIPIIILTAKADFSSKIEGLQMGADAYITKPFEKAELIVRLEKMVELREKLRQHYGDIVYKTKQDLTSSQGDILITKIHNYITDELGNSELSVTTLARELNLSHYQIYRKLRALTGKTLSQLIRSVRLQKAKELLVSTDLNISEITYEVGFNDPNYFTRVFKQEYGKTPSDIRDSSE